MSTRFRDGRDQQASPAMGVGTARYFMAEARDHESWSLLGCDTSEDGEVRH